MLAAAGNLARQGVLLRDVQSLETLSQVNAVVFDKTGTLTSDRMELQYLFTPENLKGSIDLTTPAMQSLLGLTQALAEHSWHPYARAVLQIEKSTAPPPVLQQVQEHVGQGVSATLVTDQGSSQLRMGSLSFCRQASESQELPYSAQDAQVHVFDQRGWLASYVFREVMRPDAIATMARLRQLGVEIYLMSGDKKASVETVAGRLQLEPANVFSACTPADKLGYLKDLQAAGKRVAMVGDGFNDMPVLAGAHVSFAFGQAVPLAQAHSDVVVMGQQLMAGCVNARQDSGVGIALIGVSYQFPSFLTPCRLGRRSPRLCGNVRVGPPVMSFVQSTLFLRRHFCGDRNSASAN
jgi:Cu2+-exporting ATPase